MIWWHVKFILQKELQTEERDSTKVTHQQIQSPCMECPIKNAVKIKIKPNHNSAAVQDKSFQLLVAKPIL